MQSRFYEVLLVLVVLVGRSERPGCGKSRCHSMSAFSTEEPHSILSRTPPEFVSSYIS